MMWSNLTQVSETNQNGNQQEFSASSQEMQEELQRNEHLVQQLKEMLRDSDKKLKEKEKELQEMAIKFQKFKFQSKAKSAQLFHQRKESKKDETVISDSAASIESSDLSKRGKVIMLKKQLDESRLQIERISTELQQSNLMLEKVQKEFQDKLNIKDALIESLNNAKSNEKELGEHSNEKCSLQNESVRIQEMYAQMVYKDSKIIELNSNILEQERKIMDLQEHIKVKDEILKSRNLAIQLVTDTHDKREKTVADELIETREQMKLMQENFASLEIDWKDEKSRMIHDFQMCKGEHETQIKEKDQRINHMKESLQKLESTRFELSTRNAELQEKVVLLQEEVEKDRQTAEENQNKIKQELQVAKAHQSGLQKALEEANNQVDTKILKARAKERSKVKVLEREIEALRKRDGQTECHEFNTLQLKVAELEDEKGTLQLKLMELEEQIYLKEKLQQEKEELEKSLNEMLQKLNESNELAAALEEKNKNLLMSNAEVKEILHEVQEELLVNIKRHLSVDVDIKNHINYKEASQGEIHTLKLLLQEHQDKLLVFKSTLTATKEAEVALEMRIIELEEQKEGEEIKQKELLSEIQNLKQSIEHEKQHEKEKETLKVQVHELTELYNSEQEARNFSKKLDEANLLMTEMQERSFTMLQKQSGEDEIEKYKNTIAELNYQLVNMQCLLSKQENSYKSLLLKYNEHEHQMSEFFVKFSLTDLDDLQSQWLEKCNKLNEFEQLLCLKNYELEKSDKDFKNLQKHVEEQIISLNLEKDELCEKFKQTTSENKSLEGNISEKESILFNYSVTLEAKEKELNVLNKELNDKDNAILQLNSQLEKIKDEKRALESMQSSENAKVESKFSSLLEQISDLETEVGRLQGEEVKCLQIIANLEEKTKVIENQKVECILNFTDKEKNFLDKIEKQSTLLASQHEELSVIRQKLDIMTQEYDIKFSNLKKTYDKEKQEELEKYINNISSLEAKASIVDSFISNEKKLMDEIERKDLELGEANGRIESLEENLGSVEEKLQALEHELNYHRLVRDDKMHSLKQDQIELNKEINFLKVQLNDLNLSLSCKTKEYEESQIMLEKMKIEKDMLDMQLKNTLSDIEKFVFEVKNFKLNIEGNEISQNVLQNEPEYAVKESECKVENEEKVTLTRLSELEMCKEIYNKVQEELHKYKEINSHLTKELSQTHTIIEKNETKYALKYKEVDMSKKCEEILRVKCAELEEALKSLEINVSSLKEQLQDKELDLQKVTQLLNSAESSISHMKHENVSLKQDIEIKEKCNEHIQEKLEKLKKVNKHFEDSIMLKNEQFSSQMKSLQETTDEKHLIQKKLDKSMSQICHLQKQLQESLEYVAKLEYDLKIIRESNDFLHEKVNILEDECKDKDRNLHDAFIEMKNLKSTHIETVTNETQYLQKLVQNLEIQLNEKENDYKSVLIEKDNLLQKISEMEYREHSLQDNIQSINEDKDRLTKIVNEMTIASQTLSCELHQSAEAANSLQNELETLKLDCQKSKELLETEVCNSVSQDSVLECTNKDLFNHIKILLHRCSETGDNNRFLQEQLNESEQKINHYQNEVHKLQKNIETQQIHLNDQLEEAKCQYQELEKECNHLKIIQNEYNSSLQMLKVLEDQHLASKSYCDKMKDETNKLTSYIQALEDSNKSLNEQLKLNDVEIQKLNINLKDVFAEKSLLDNMVLNLKSEVSIRDNKIAALESELHLLLGKVEDLKHNIYSQEIMPDVELTNMNLKGKLLDDECNYMTDVISSQLTGSSTLKSYKQNIYSEKQNFLDQVQEQQNLELHKEESLEKCCQELHLQLCQPTNITLLQSSSSEHVQNISSQLEEYGSHIHSLNAEILTQEKDIQNLHENIADAKQHIENYMKEAAIAKDKCKEVIFKLEIRDKGFQLLSAEKELQDKEIENINNNFEELNNVNTKLKTIINEHIIKIDELHKKNKTLNQNFHHKVKELTVCKTHLEELIHINTNHESATQYQNNQLEEKANLLANLKTHVTDLEIESNLLKNSLQESKQENSSILKDKQQVLEKSNNIITLKTEVEKLKSGIELLEKQKVDVQNNLDSVILQIDSLKDEKKFLNNSLLHCEAEIIRLNKANHALQKILDERDSNLDDLNKESKNVTSLKIQSGNETDLLDEKILPMELKLQKQISKNIALKKIVSESEVICTQCKKVKDEYVQKCDEIKMLKNEIQEKEALLLILEKQFKDLNLFQTHAENKTESSLEYNEDISSTMIKGCWLKNILELKSLVNNNEAKLQEAVHFAEKVKISEQRLKEEVQKLQHDNLSLYEEKNMLKETLENKEKELFQEQQNFRQKIDELKLGGSSGGGIESVSVQNSEIQMSSLRNQQNEELRKENENLLKQVRNTKAKSVQIFAKLKLFKEQNDKYYTELDNLRKETLDLKQNIKTLENEKNELSLRLSEIKKYLSFTKSELHKADSKCSHDTDVLEIIKTLRTENFTLIENFNKLTIDAQEYKQKFGSSLATLEEKNICIQELSQKLKDNYEQTNKIENECINLNEKCSYIEIEKASLHQELINAKEHADMLASDNETFQGIVESLRKAKNTLEGELRRQKEHYIKEIKDSKNLSLQDSNTPKEEDILHMKDSTINDLEMRNSDIRAKYFALEKENDAMKQQLYSVLTNNKCLLDHNTFMHNGLLNLCRKTKLLKENRNLDFNQSSNQMEAYCPQHSKSGNFSFSTFEHLFATEELKLNIGEKHHISTDQDEEELVTETSDLLELQNKSEHSNLIEVLCARWNFQSSSFDSLLQLLQETDVYWRKISDDQKIFFQNMVIDLENHLETTKQNELKALSSLMELQVQNQKLLNENEQKDNEIYACPETKKKKHETESNIHQGEIKKLQAELNQAMQSLHLQGIRCEELNIEINRLLEERETLKCQLDHNLHYSQQKDREANLYDCSLSSSIENLGTLQAEIHKCPSDVLRQEAGKELKYVSSSQSHAEITILKQRLVQSEMALHELQNINESLDRALQFEQECRKLTEKELINVKEQIVLDMHSPSKKGEYHLLMEGNEDREIVIETTHSISRRVRGHAYKLQQWICGRRNFCYRNLRIKSTAKVIAIIYFSIIHIWFLTCIL